MKRSRTPEEIQREDEDQRIAAVLAHFPVMNRSARRTKEGRRIVAEMAEAVEDVRFNVADGVDASGDPFGARWI